jgi:hypothetical protein
VKLIKAVVATPTGPLSEDVVVLVIEQAPAVLDGSSENTTGLSDPPPVALAT